jgi:predicted nucleic acid-binding protein
MSWELASELVAVLRLPAIRHYGITEADIEAVVDVLGPLLPGVDLAVDVRDPDDVVVVGAVLAGSAAAIVTGDRDLLDDADLRAWLAARGVEVITPTALLERRADRP